MLANETVRVLAAQLVEGDEVPIAILPVAVPYFFVRLTAICVERREISVLREYLLRAAHLGFVETKSLAGFLGVSEEEANGELLTLVSEFFIAANPKTGTYSLLEKGTRTISASGLTRTVIRESACYVHGATHKVDIPPHTLVPRRKLPKGVLVLPAIPARAPRLDELDAIAVKASMMATRNSLPRILEVTRLGRIVRTDSLFRLGFVLLRRDSRAMPQVCVDGAVDLELVQRYAPHPALKQVMSIVRRHDQLVKRTISQHQPEMKKAGTLPTQDVRGALTKLVSYSDALASAHRVGEQLLAEATQPLVARSAWVCAPEAQVLLARALVIAQRQIVVAASPLSYPLLDRGALESLAIALRKGIAVTIYVETGDVRFAANGELLRNFLNGVKLIHMPAASEWCGFCCDDQFAVVGKTKTSDCSMGRFESFFGALVLSNQQPEQLLRELAISSGVPVTVKVKPRALALPPRKA